MQQSFESKSVGGRVKYKLVFLGDMGVGKTSIIQRFIKNRFEQKHNPTVAIDFFAKNVVYNNVNYRLQLWDTAGQEKFKSLIPGYLKDANCAIFVFDLGNRQSYNNVKIWLQIFTDNSSQGAISIMLGNKLDAQRKITFQEANQKSRKLGLKYYEISAKTAEGLDHFFFKVIEDIKQTNKSHQPIVETSKTQREIIEKPKVKSSLQSLRERDCCSI